MIVHIYKDELWPEYVPVPANETGIGDFSIECTEEEYLWIQKTREEFYLMQEFIKNRSGRQE